MLAERSPSPWPLQCPVAYLRRPSAKIRPITTSTMIQCKSVNFVTSSPDPAVPHQPDQEQRGDVDQECPQSDQRTTQPAR